VYDLVGFVSITLVVSPVLLLAFLYLEFVDYSRQFIQKNIILRFFPSLEGALGKGNKVISKLRSTLWFCSISFCIVFDIMLFFWYG
jgi:hypothetical protein